ncbi:hypothetical protein QYE76_052915 [Lolium multiflorum]|uniref:RING-type domain-containing protein n=1 Tax=Lolium multiflorum TaxID=4521 RepID=A0AAD8SUT4_LOLMU|nr:hypothetical protein QYE76_052915 [Lolium multiflorum]
MGAEEEEETAGEAEGSVLGGDGEGGDGAAEEGERPAAVVSCSICLDAVITGGDERSTAKLQCGHEFHLDCIGSAFNAKGVMQCPNCRKIEKGNWFYANGSHPSQDPNIDEHGEDFPDVGYSEMGRGIFLPYRFQWCPVGRLAQLPSLFDDVESSPAITFHDFMGQNFTSEHLPVSAPGATHPGPYVAYFQPLPSPSSSSSPHVTERTMEGATYHDHWSSLAGVADGRPMQTLHPIDFEHNHWAHIPLSYSQPNSNNGVTEQPGVPVGAMRVGGLDRDSQQRGSLPSVYGNGSGSRSRIPNAPPMVSQFMRAHGNLSEQYQQSSSSLYAGSQLSGGMRPLGAPGPGVPPLVDSTSFSMFPPAPSGPASVEPEDSGGNQLYAWERDRFAPYPLIPVGSEASWWGSSQQPHGTLEPAAVAAAASRRLFGQWIGIGSSQPQQVSPPADNRSSDNSPYRQMHIPRM